MNPVQIRLTRRRDVVIIHLAGEIDLANVEGLRHDLLSAVSNDVPMLVLDLDEVSYIDSSGVRMLFELAGHLELARQRLALSVRRTSRLRRVLMITRIEDVCDVVASIDEALEIGSSR